MLLPIHLGTELPSELLQTLLKMTLTSEEELKLRLYTGDLMLLGPAERFLKILVEIPFAFKRMESLLFMSSLPEEVSTIKESFIALEIASDKLQNSRLFLKLLEAVLKTGNRMNDGTYRGGAMAFKLDTLLKLSDVKGTDGKTTLLHFVVQEIIRSEGLRAVRIARNQSVSSTISEDLVEESNQSLEHYRNLGLKVVSGLSTELRDVKKAAAVDADGLASTMTKLKQSLTKTKAFLDTEMKPLDEDSKFYSTLSSFADHADSEIAWILEEQKRIMAVVQRTADYFHGNAGKNEGIHLFSIVRDFLVMLDKACKEVKDVRETTPMKTSKKETPTPSTSLENRQQSDSNRQRLFPAIAERRIDYSSSDDES
uniref:Formin-like protein n=1 Tax=Manihot esculenta TaxID=3983 RepID=A0A2C9UPW8_MANES